MMNKPFSLVQDSTRIRLAFRLVMVFWIALVGMSLFLNWRQAERSAADMALTEARSSFNKDLVYRRWATMHGGVYVPPTENTPPNPYLSDLADRDVETTTGKKLTLVNPAYMTRQVHELGQEQYGSRGHITSLNPIRPKNGADAWETKALQAFQAGSGEVSSVEILDGQPFLRLMRPMIAEAGCLKCHAAQGYREGDIRGGISVSVPFAPYLETAGRQQTLFAAAHGLIGFLGLFGIWLGGRSVAFSQAALREGRDRLELALHGADLGTWDWNVATGDATFNERWAEMLGYTLDEIEPRASTWEKMVHPDDLPRVQEVLDAHLEGKTDFYETEHRLKHKSGHWVWILDKGRVIERDADGRPHRACGTHLDITYRKRAEEETEKLEAQLRQAQKLEAIGTLAGGIAHDFNNILAAILGFTEIAMDGIPQNCRSHHDLEQVLGAALRAKDLVKQILAFSRQGETLARQPITVAPIIKEALKLLRATLPTTIEFRQDISKDSGTILGDPTQVHQVVVNLCTNAAHAMRKTGGLLEVILEAIELDAASARDYENLRPGPFVKLTVKDTGHGMDSATLGRIFDPYFTTKAVGEGSGLGLAVIHGIVKRHEGAIAVRSEPGKGTVFEILLPRVVKGHERVEDDPRTLPGGTERILLVDDEEPLVALGERMLVQLGYRVTTRTKSHEAIELFQSEPDAFDLVITDYTMPHMTGLDLARGMLRIRPNIPIVLCTGYSEMVSEATAHDSGVRAFIMKPLARRNIAEVVRNVLDEEKP